MVRCRKEFEVSNGVVTLISVPVVNVVPVRDASVVALPYVAVHGDTAMGLMACLVVAVRLPVKPDAISLLDRMLAAALTTEFNPVFRCHIAAVAIFRADTPTALRLAVD